MNNRIHDKAIVDELARQLSIPLPLARHSADEILAIVREGLLRDGVVTITHLGTFRLKPVAARLGFNPNTRERISIPAHQRVVFTPAKALRDAAEPPRQPAVPIAAGEKAAPPVAAFAPVPNAAETTTEQPSQAEVALHHDTATTPIEVHFEPEPRTPPEISPAPALSMSTLAGNSIEPTPNRIASPHGKVPASMPEVRFEQEPALSAPLVIDPVEAPYTPALVAQKQEPAALPAAALRMSAGNSWATRKPVIATIEPPHSHSTRNYFLATMAVMAVGGYIAYTLNNTTNRLNASPSSMSTVPAKAPVADAAEANFFFKEQQYRIVAGDNLWRIADVHYQQAALWPHIYRANTDTIRDPDFLVNGMTITIPGLEGPPDKLSETDRRNIARGYYLAHLFYKSTGHKDAESALVLAKYFDANVVEQAAISQ